MIAVVERAAVTLAALAAVETLNYIPLPGIEVTALGSMLATGMAPLARVSTGSLNVWPLFTACTAFEIWRMVIGRTRISWANEKFVVPLALMITAVQAYSMAEALATLRGFTSAGNLALVTDPVWPFVISTVVTPVAATALICWLANVVTRHGVGSGLWVLLTAPQAEAFVEFAAGWGPYQTLGPKMTDAQPLILAFVVAATALMAALERAKAAGEPPTNIDPWAAAIAASAAPYVYSAFSTIFSGSDPFAHGYFMTETAVAWHLYVITLAALFTAVSLVRGARLGPRPLAHAIPSAFAGAAIILAADLVGPTDGPPLSGENVIIGIATALAVVRAVIPPLPQVPVAD